MCYYSFSIHPQICCERTASSLHLHDSRRPWAWAWAQWYHWSRGVPPLAHSGNEHFRPPWVSSSYLFFQYPGAGACKTAAAAGLAIVLPSSFSLAEPCPPWLLLLLQSMQLRPKLFFSNMDSSAYARCWRDSGILYSNTGDGILDNIEFQQNEE